jgi:hypothetical protein
MQNFVAHIFPGALGMSVKRLATGWTMERSEIGQECLLLYIVQGQFAPGVKRQTSEDHSPPTSA